MGTAAAYKEKALIGVEALVVLLPKKARDVLAFFTYLLLLVLCSVMLYFSFTYVSSSSKITAALEVSYAYINTSIIISFALMTFYTLIFVVKSFKKAFLTKSN